MYEQGMCVFLFSQAFVSLLLHFFAFFSSLGDVYLGGDVGSSASPPAGGRQPPQAVSPSTWKEEELLLKLSGEIKARNPNLEVKTFSPTIWIVSCQSALSADVIPTNLPQLRTNLSRTNRQALFHPHGRPAVITATLKSPDEVQLYQNRLYGDIFFPAAV